MLTFGCCYHSLLYVRHIAAAVDGKLSDRDRHLQPVDIYMSALVYLAYEMMFLLFETVPVIIFHFGENEQELDIGLEVRSREFVVLVIIFTKTILHRSQGIVRKTALFRRASIAPLPMFPSLTAWTIYPASTKFRCRCPGCRLQVADSSYPSSSRTDRTCHPGSSVSRLWSQNLQ